MKNENHDLICYNTDRSLMSGIATMVVFPSSINEVKDIIFNSQNLVPRGLGENIVGACVPNNSVVVDMKKMNKINFDFKTKLVQVDAGVTIKELNEKLKSIGYELPIIVDGTIGGGIAMNVPSLFGGYANIKEWIEEIEFVNGRGELVKFSRSDVGEICGFEGTTGIIVSAKLNVISYQEKSASIFQSNDIEEIFLIIKRLKLEKGIVMMRLYSPYFSNLLGFPRKYHIVIVFNNSSGKIKGEAFDLLIRKVRKDHYLMYKNGYSETEDPKLLFEKIKDFVIFLNKMAVPYSGDLNLGIIFPYFKNEIQKQEVIKMIGRLNGKPGKYGIGIKRKNRVEDLQKKIIKRVKMRHDPFLKMNVGKLIDMDSFEDFKDKNVGKNDNEGLGNVKSDNYVVSSAKGIVNSQRLLDTNDRPMNSQKTPEKDLDSFIQKMEQGEDSGNVKIGDNLDRSISRAEEIPVDRKLMDKILFNKGPEDNENIGDKNEDNKN